MTARDSRPRLRVVLALPAAAFPAWIHRLKARLHEAKFIELTTAEVEQEPKQAQGRSFFFDLWMWLETKAFGHKISVDEHSEELVRSSAELNSLPDDLDADVIVWMLPGRPPSEILGKANYGVLTIPEAFDAMFGLDEYLRQEPATRCDIVTLGSEPEGDSVLTSSYANTDAVLFTRGISGIRAKCRALLLATLKRLWLREDPRLDGLPQEPEARRIRNAPSTLRIIRGATGIFARFAADRLFPRGRFDQWQLAYRLGGDRQDQTQMKYLAPAHQGFWADPFIAEREGRRFIFFEELSPETNRGHLAAIEVHPDGRAGDPINVLMSEHHLSYPFLFEHESSLFMVPECGSSRRVEVLRCERFPDRWTPHAVLLDGMAAFDPTLVEHDGRWWMFVTIEHDGNSCNDELHLFYAEDVFGDWMPHALNPVRLDVRAARPAGAIFHENGKLYRPAQDCSGRYGRAISIQEIQRMTPEEYVEVGVHRISAEFAPDALGTHTVNQAHGIVVFDCEVRARKTALGADQ